MNTLITANRNYSSWSLRPWVLMRALGIPFVDRVEPFTQPVNWQAFRAFSPTGQVPVLIDGETTVWDSLGITLFLADRHAGRNCDSAFDLHVGRQSMWLDNVAKRTAVAFENRERTIR